ncbi:RluA family pseudouridine synthase [Lacticaseibacillus absianus]|uniref:RluA family pseudouridine synthase n=1 Tax=Lacticaseibacillus absianus TaxID=2729623 RepID=UPI0015C8162E|nr:RluA family pseudouridine synthase [Lacticaseibacillus absianus]
MRYTFNFKANKATTVKRLLAKNGVSHRLFKRLLDAGMVWLNNSQLKGNAEMIHGATVRIELPPSAEVAVSHAALTVMLELPNWLVVVKPTGLASVPGPSNPTDSLLNRVAGYLAAAGVEGPQPAIITRLDRDTEGLVLVAKHPYAQGRLDAEAAQLTKQYRAVVTGRPQPASGTIALPLAKAEDGIHRMVAPDGQPARTDYRTVATAGDMSLVELTLFTGRTHQIRVHMAALGHPLVGDPLYGTPTAATPHQWLQAFALSFTDPFDGQTHAVTLPQPADWPHLV